MSSKNAHGDMCMDWPSNHKDAAAILGSFLDQQRLRHLPLYALGVSVGGGFVAKLAAHIKVGRGAALAPAPGGRLVAQPGHPALLEAGRLAVPRLKGIMAAWPGPPGRCWWFLRMRACSAPHAAATQPAYAAAAAAAADGWCCVGGAGP